MERNIYVYFQTNLTLIDKICLQKLIRLLTYCHMMTRCNLTFSCSTSDTSNGAKNYIQFNAKGNVTFM